MGICKDCKFYVDEAHLQQCSHCQQSFCANHMIAHDKKIVFELRDVPRMVRK